jgi:predicted O-methyltransferase YrrM
MAKRTQLLSPEIYDYVMRASSREPDVLARLRHATASLPESEMQIGPDQGQFLAFLVKLIGARRCIEIGTYTGYSALAVALALPADGRLVACDVSEPWTSVGRPFWREAGVEARIDLKIRPALETLDELLANGEHGTFDFAFLDADKPNYAAYYEKLLVLLRGGALIAADNTLALAGAPIMKQQTANAKALRAFNDFVRGDERVDVAMLTIGEGLTLLRKRA